MLRLTNMEADEAKGTEMFAVAELYTNSKSLSCHRRRDSTQGFQTVSQETLSFSDIAANKTAFYKSLLHK